MSSSTHVVHPVDEKLPLGRLATLGFQHVLVMYAGAIAVPLIVGPALKLPPDQIAMLIQADLFCCGLVTLIQSLGVTRWLGIRMPVMMGVTFTAVSPMLAVAAAHPGTEGASLIFGGIIGAGVISLFLAPLMSRLLRFFPPVVTGTIIAVIGISLMKVAISWVFGFGPSAIVSPEHGQWLETIKGLGGAVPSVPQGLELVGTKPNPGYAQLPHMAIAGVSLLAILLIAKFARGFVSNISILLGIVIAAAIAAAMGFMNFEEAAKAQWFDLVLPFEIATPTFDPMLILTMTLVMIVTMIESTGMFLALGEIVDKKIEPQELSAGLRADGLGAIVGGVFNTFAYTSFSQNVGLVGVTGVKSRYVCVTAAVILILLGMFPKMAALVASLPTFVLGGAGLVMFGMVATTGIRILSSVDYKTQRNNLFIVSVSIGLGLIPMIAPHFSQWLPQSLHLMVESGIMLATISAVILNLFFNGKGSADVRHAIEAAKAADAH